MIQITNFELSLHIILFIVAATTPLIIYMSYRRFTGGEFKTIIKYFMIAMFFSALRWTGGSLARLRLDFTETITYNIIWTFTGIIAAVSGIYASKLLLDYSKLFGFEQLKKFTKKRK